MLGSFATIKEGVRKRSSLKGKGKNATHFGIDEYEYIPREFITGGGVYAYLPFDNLDKDKKAMFKIGMTTNFRRRENNYHTYLPEGMWRVAILQNPTKYQGSRTDGEFYKVVEHNIFEKIRANGGKVLSKQYRKAFNEGETEWIYADVKMIHKAFREARERFGGKVYVPKLELPDRPNTLFVGKIFFE